MEGRVQTDKKEIKLSSYMRKFKKGAVEKSYTV